MFVMSKENVRKVLSGKMDYGARPFDEDNEISKGFHFEDQAIVNAILEEHYAPVCDVLENLCEKESCELYKLGTGKLKQGWACKEYKVDFPSATFDSRFHVALIGNDKIDQKDSLEHLAELEREGARFVCLGCHRPYEKKPEELYEDGHGGRYLEMCPCGSDLFESVRGFRELLKK